MIYTLTAFLRSISPCSLLLSQTSHCCRAVSRTFTDNVPPHCSSCFTARNVRRQFYLQQINGRHIVFKQIVLPSVLTINNFTLTKVKSGFENTSTRRNKRNFNKHILTISEKKYVKFESFCTTIHLLITINISFVRCLYSATSHFNGNMHSIHVQYRQITKISS